jgi:hypothetical protein
MSNLELKKLKESYEIWRSGRGAGRGQTPLELRESALELAKRYGDKAVREALELSRASLWNWRRPSSRKVKRNPIFRQGSARRSKIKFIEVKPPAALSAVGFLPFQVEWERGDGQKMRVSGFQSLAEVQELALGFLKLERGVQDAPV